MSVLPEGEGGSSGEGGFLLRSWAGDDVGDTGGEIA